MHGVSLDINCYRMISFILHILKVLVTGKIELEDARLTKPHKCIQDVHILQVNDLFLVLSLIISL